MWHKFFKKQQQKTDNSNYEYREHLLSIRETRSSFYTNRPKDEIDWFYVDEIRKDNVNSGRPAKKLGSHWLMENEFFEVHERNLICFFDTTNNLEYRNYIQNNHSEIAEAFAARRWNYVERLSQQSPDINAFNLHYYFPFHDWNNVKLQDQTNHTESEFAGNEILSFYNYKGPIKTGFIGVLGRKYCLISKKKNESIDEFVSSFYSIISRWHASKICYAQDPDFYGDTELDNESANHVRNIKVALNALKENGQFFRIAPLVLKIVEEASKKAPKISRMVIDKDFKILLPDYQNREIKLSHLTKAIYFLILRHPKGVYTGDWDLYKKELLDIYKRISYRLDMDKMEESIEELGNSDEKALRTHISRIKASFKKEFSDYYASKYYITGKDIIKSIDLDRSLLTWETDL
ncbi:hypothetical protein [Niabella aquatica]